MSYQRARICLTVLVLGGAFFISNAHAGATFDFVFTGQCDDCAFIGDPSDPGFDPLGDGLFETVSGTLRLTDITLDASGVIAVGSGNFDSFTYDGSSLLNPFTFTDPFLIRGELSAAGEVQPGKPLKIETSAGDFSTFCTALGEQVLAADGVFCDSITMAMFELDSSGDWSLSGSEGFDIGASGQLTPAGTVAAGEPLSAALLGLGLLGVGRRTPAHRVQ